MSELLGMLVPSWEAKFVKGSGVSDQQESCISTG